MTTISLGGVLPRATAGRPARLRERLAAALRPRHLILLLAAAVGVFVVGHAGFMLDLTGSAGSLVLSTTAVQTAIVVAAIGIDLAVGAAGRHRAALTRAVELERALADACAQAQRLQLQPHFVFNALQAAATLVHQDAVKADLMLVALADFLRLTMQTAEAREIPLVTELALLDRYVEVMRHRFGDRLRVTVNADAETLDAHVPQLLLQPLVENAIRHGLREDGGTIHVRVVRDGETLRCLVHDDGGGLRPGVRGGGIGLRATRGRLAALYGEAGHCDLADSPDGGVAATVTLPFHTRAGERAA